MARPGNSSGLALFAAELAAQRARAGLSQEDLAGQLHYSLSLVTSVERMRRAPSLEFAQRCDAIFDTGGTLERMHRHARTMPLPDWFRPFAELEASAVALRLFEHSCIPGLFQTEELARAMLGTEADASGGDLDALVAARMARQEVLSRAGSSLMVWALVDESALNRRVGGPDVMRDQLLHLVKVCAMPGVTLQVVPLDAGAHPGMSGACDIAEAEDGTRAAYVETMADGHVTDDVTVVRRVIVRWEL